MKLFHHPRILFLSGAATMLAALLTVTLLTAGDFALPHRLQPGDVISADVINEIMDYIAARDKTITSADLVGSWTCVQSSATGPYASDVADADNVVYSRTFTITFTNDGDGTYSWISTPYSPFLRQNDSGDTLRTSGKYAVYNNVLYGTYDSASSKYSVPVQRLSPTRLMFTNYWNGVSVAFYDVCDKLNQPPAIPTGLAASVSGRTVTLTWNDNSSDETGFDVIRKDNVTASFTTVTTTASNVTTYTDTAPAAGDYWYRVWSTNANGDSLGSNVVKVTLQ